MTVLGRTSLVEAKKRRTESVHLAQAGKVAARKRFAIARQ
jgi:hypothetical protein